MNHLAANYNPLPFLPVRGEGPFLYDADGLQVIDFHSGYCATGLGHCHPSIVFALTDQARKLAVTSRGIDTYLAHAVADKLCALTKLDLMLPSSGGAEAIETAIKAARAWGYTIKGITADQAIILVASENFHGRSTTITGLSTFPEYRANYGPFSPGFDTFTFGDIDSLESKLRQHGDNVAAVLIEPVQGEAGVIIPPAGYLAAVRRVTGAANVLLIVDEIQCGLGRTGKMFAYQHDDIQPDGVVVGKTLGGGVLPVSAFVASREVLECIEPGTHGSTFGGNPLAMAVAYEALCTIERQGLVDNAFQLGETLKQRLFCLRGHPAIKRSRSIGLWGAIELKGDACARQVCEDLLPLGLLVKDTHHNTIRIAPPLTISKPVFLRGLEILSNHLRSL